MSTLNQIKVEDTLYDIEDIQARKELLNKVNKVEGKGLSTNDFTDEDKEKLETLSNSDNEIFRVNMTLNGTEYVPDKTYVEVIQAHDEGKMVQCEIELDGVKMVLPLCSINKTDFYVIYGGATEIMTLAVLQVGNDYIQIITRMLATQEELGEKQDNLISGQNIKTINGEDILGVGNIEIQGGSGEGVPTADDWIKIATVSFIKDDETIRHIISLDENGKEFSYDELLLIGSGNDGGGNLTIWFNTEERFTTDSGNINNFFDFGQTPTALIGRLLDKQYYILSQSQSLTRFTISSRFDTTKGKIQMIVLQRGVTTNKCNITVYGRNLNES